MQIVAVEYRTVRWPIAQRGPARRWHERTAVILSVRDDTGAIGLGEAAPLPGMSPDTVEEVESACAALARRVPFMIAEPSAIAARTTAAPAARFAIESALMAVVAQRQHISIAGMIAPIPQSRITSAIVVDDELQARAAVTAGAPCLKLKVDRDLERIRRIASAVPGTRLRLDANRGWPRSDVPAFFEELADLPIELIEEPCVGTLELLDSALPIPVALDESLVGVDRDVLVRALASHRLGALVLKPTLLGGFARCLELAAAARAHDVRSIVTHSLEGPIGTAACRELARAVIGGPHGVADHPALERFAEAV